MSTRAQEIVDLELGRLHEAAKAGELSIDQARKLVLYLKIHEPGDSERPLADLSDEQLREALSRGKAEGQ
jgi:hypothetical protein